MPKNSTLRSRVELIRRLDRIPCQDTNPALFLLVPTLSAARVLSAGSVPGPLLPRAEVRASRTTGWYRPYLLVATALAPKTDEQMTQDHTPSRRFFLCRSGALAARRCLILGDAKELAEKSPADPG